MTDWTFTLDASWLRRTKGAMRWRPPSSERPLVPSALRLVANTPTRIQVVVLSTDGDVTFNLANDNDLSDKWVQHGHFILNVDGVGTLGAATDDEDNDAIEPYIYEGVKGATAFFAALPTEGDVAMTVTLDDTAIDAAHVGFVAATVTPPGPGPDDPAHVFPAWYYQPSVITSLRALRMYRRAVRRGRVDRRMRRTLR